MISLALVFCFSAILCVVTTPLLKHLAIKCGQVDNPDGVRKTHPVPIPLSGGVGILISSTAALVGIQVLGWSITNEGEVDPTFLLGLLASSVFICLLGIMDDRYLLRGRYKLCGQLLAIGPQ